MSDDSKEVEILLDDKPTANLDTGVEPVIEIVPEGDAAPEAEAESPKDVEKALKKLNKKLEKERRARQEAEQRAQAAEVQARSAFNEVTDTNLHLVGNAIETVKRDQEILTSNLKVALENGEYEKAAEIQHSMATNNSKLVDLERGYAEMKAQPRAPVQPVAPSPKEVTVDDLINRVTPKSAKWLKENRDNLKSPKSIRIMARAHDDAMDMGITPESASYFRFIEQRLGIGEEDRNRQEESTMSAASQPVQKRSAPPSAPVSRAPMNSPNRPGVVRLTEAQLEAARISGITPQEYYRNLIRERERTA